MTRNRHYNVYNCLEVVDNAPNGVEGCLDFQTFDREAHTEINDSAHCTGTNRISNSIDIPQLPLSFILRMCFSLGKELFATNTRMTDRTDPFQRYICRTRMCLQECVL